MIRLSQDEGTLAGLLMYAHVKYLPCPSPPLIEGWLWCPGTVFDSLKVDRVDTTCFTDEQMPSHCVRVRLGADVICNSSWASAHCSLYNIDTIFFVRLRMRGKEEGGSGSCSRDMEEN